mgnify:CR=1 FL=1
MIPITFILGPNCKLLEHNWVIVKQRETWEAKGKFLEIISCNLHAIYIDKGFCKYFSYALTFGQPCMTDLQEQNSQTETQPQVPTKLIMHTRAKVKKTFMQISYDN